MDDDEFLLESPDDVEQFVKSWRLVWGSIMVLLAQLGDDCQSAGYVGASRIQKKVALSDSSTTSTTSTNSNYSSAYPSTSRISTSHLSSPSSGPKPLKSPISSSPSSPSPSSSLSA